MLVSCAVPNARATYWCVCDWMCNTGSSRHSDSQICGISFCQVLHTPPKWVLHIQDTTRTKLPIPPFFLFLVKKEVVKRPLRVDASWVFHSSVWISFSSGSGGQEPKRGIENYGEAVSQAVVFNTNLVGEEQLLLFKTQLSHSCFSRHTTLCYN